MQKWLLVFLLLPVLATAQLKEFEVSEMERPDVAVVQANTQWPDDALLLVYSSLKDLNFRSSLGGIDKVSYNPQSNRYEILFKPNKQMLFVYASNFVEQKIETFNPNPKDVFYYKVEEKQQAVVNTKPGTLKIVTEPSGADVFINGIQTVNKTPFTGELPAQVYALSISQNDYSTIDTLISIVSGQMSILHLRLNKKQGQFKIITKPEGAGVFVDDIYVGTAPYEGTMDVGAHTVACTMSCYLDKKEIMSVQQDREVMVSIVMGDDNRCIDPLGKEYQTVKIGEQTWMAEDIAYSVEQGEYSTQGYSTGYRYSWEVANGVCPVCWHLPAYAEWEKLFDFVRDPDPMTEDGHIYPRLKNTWEHPTEAEIVAELQPLLRYLDNDSEKDEIKSRLKWKIGTNETGFNAVPNVPSGYAALWWTSTEHNDGFFRAVSLTSMNRKLNKYLMTHQLAGVRCVRD